MMFDFFNISLLKREFKNKIPKKHAIKNITKMVHYTNQGPCKDIGGMGSGRLCDVGFMKPTSTPCVQRISRKSICC